MSSPSDDEEREIPDDFDGTIFWMAIAALLLAALGWI